MKLFGMYLVGVFVSLHRILVIALEDLLHLGSLENGDY